VVERKGEELELKDDKWIFDFYIRVPEGGVIQFDHIKGRGGLLKCMEEIVAASIG
jgi:hypothetical protein